MSGILAYVPFKQHEKVNYSLALTFKTLFKRGKIQFKPKNNYYFLRVMKAFVFTKSFIYIAINYKIIVTIGIPSPILKSYVLLSGWNLERMIIAERHTKIRCSIPVPFKFLNACCP